MTTITSAEETSGSGVYETPASLLGSRMNLRTSPRKLITGIAAVGLFGLLAACKPVVGNLNDKTPPVISFTVGGHAVSANHPFHMGSTAQQVVATASDSGGVDSLETAIVNHFVCTAGGASDAETDSNPQALRGFDYSLDQHVYFAHRTTPDAFWPDTNNNGVNDPSEHNLRYNQLVVISEASIVQLSVDAYTPGSDCIMSDGTTHGVVSSDVLVITATATNARSEILSAPHSQGTTNTSITLTL